MDIALIIIVIESNALQTQKTTIKTDLYVIIVHQMVRIKGIINSIFLFKMSLFISFGFNYRS